MPKASPTLIFILGMHRSGTSAAARLVNLLGARLGDELLRPKPGINDTGFWEHRGVVRINRALFAHLKSDWYDGRLYPHQWWQEKHLFDLMDQAADVLINAFDGAELAAVKDPRLCRLLPFWQTVADRLKWRCGYLLVLRHPVEVVRSLIRRDPFDLKTAAFLWLVYVLESERHTRGRPRAIVTYDAVLADWQRVANEVARCLQIQWPQSIDAAAAAVTAEIHSGHRHQIIRPDESDEADGVGKQALEVYAFLEKNAQGSDLNKLDDLYDTFCRYRQGEHLVADALYGSNTHLVEKTRELMQLGAAHQQALDMIDERDAQLEALVPKLEWLRSNRLFHLMKPLVRKLLNTQ